MANQLSPEEIHRLRCLAASWLEWSCADDAVDEQHPRYVRVTEGRDPGPGYSSCADLAHWLYFRLGCRERWVNRAEHRGWKMEVNVSRIVAVSEPWRPRQLYAGDVLCIANRWPSGTDAHIVCVITHDEGLLCTAEYGQPGGALKIYREFDGRRIGHRLVRTVMPLEARLRAAAEAGLLKNLRHHWNSHASPR